MREQLWGSAGQSTPLSESDYHKVTNSPTEIPVNMQTLSYLRDPAIGPWMGILLGKDPELARRLILLSSK
jgi:hypothetical protein